MKIFSLLALAAAGSFALGKYFMRGLSDPLAVPVPGARRQPWHERNGYLYDESSLY